MGESFWQNNSLVTYILFELQPIIILSLVANFGDQSLEVQKIKFIALQTIVFRLCFEILQLLIPECINDKKSYGDIVWQLANT